MKKTSYVIAEDSSHTAFLTVIWALTRTSGAALTSCRLRFSSRSCDSSTRASLCLAIFHCGALLLDQGTRSARIPGRGGRALAIFAGLILGKGLILLLGTSTAHVTLAPLQSVSDMYAVAYVSGWLLALWNGSNRCSAVKGVA